MATPNQSTAAKPAKKPRKVTQSPARIAAEAALKAAKSDQEKAAARGHVKVLRFREITVPRVNKALKTLGQIERMANRAAYTWTDEEAAKVTQALKGAVDKIAAKFNGAAKTLESFTL